MIRSLDYYFTPTSPWAYLGHARFEEIARRHGATVAVKPVDYGVIFPQSGGLPLGKQMAIVGDFLRAVWAEQRNIADIGVLTAIAAR